MIPEANRLPAVLPLRDVTIGIAGGFPIRIGALDRNVQDIQRGHRLPMPLVSNIVVGTDEVTIVGGIVLWLSCRWVSQGWIRLANGGIAGRLLCVRVIL